MERENPFTMDILLSEPKVFVPSLSVDCVILGFSEGTLKVLLNKFEPLEKWMLPGGFVLQDEDVDTAALRVLKNRTGLDDVFLRQFHLFGRADRTNKNENQKILERASESKADESHWYLQRFVSLGYYALVEYDQIHLYSNEGEENQWFNLNEIPEMYSDHNKIVTKALDTIRLQLGFIPIGYQLLPEKFTMPELRAIYESIIGEELDRRNFQRKMLSIGLLTRLNEKRKVGAHKSPYLYSFNKEKYEHAEKHGLQLMTWRFL